MTKAGGAHVWKIIDVKREDENGYITCQRAKLSVFVGVTTFDPIAWKHVERAQFVIRGLLQYEQKWRGFDTYAHRANLDLILKHMPNLQPFVRWDGLYVDEVAPESLPELEADLVVLSGWTPVFVGIY
jgi:hypothetical protein